MPAGNKTDFLELNLWKGNEYVKREDFNNDNAVLNKYFKSLAFADMALIAMAKGMKYFYDKSDDTHTEIVGATKDTPFMKRTSTKISTGWSIRLE